MGLDAVLSMNKSSKSATQRLFSFTSNAQTPKIVDVKFVYATGLDNFEHLYSPPNSCVLKTNRMFGVTSESSIDGTNSINPLSDRRGKLPQDIC